MTVTELRTTRWAAVVAMAAAVVLASLDMTIVAVALPAIGADLAAAPAAIQWVMLAYFLPMVALSVPVGRWIDRVQARAAFFLATVGFGVASVLVAVATLLISLVPLPTVEAATETRLYLALMHIAVGVVLILGLRASAAVAPAPAVATGATK